MGNNITDYPILLNAKDIQQIIKCSYRQALKIMNEPSFPLLKKSGKKLVFRDRFFEWLEHQAS